MCPQQLDGRCRLQDVVGDLRIHHRHSGDVEDHDLGLLFDDLEEHCVHDLMGALSIYRSHNRKKEDSIVNLDHRCGKLADRGLMASHRFQVRGNIGVDSQGHIEEDHFADALQRFRRFGYISFEVLEQPCVN